MNFRQTTKKIYYFFKNPVYKFYCFLFRPISLGVKVVVENNNKLLLVRLSYAHKKWTFPGGGVKKKESFEQAALRELEEETGIKVAPLLEIGEYKSESNYKKNIVRCFYAVADSSFVQIDNFEISKSGWYDKELLPEDCSSSVLRIIEIYKNYKANR